MNLSPALVQVNKTLPHMKPSPFAEMEHVSVKLGADGGMSANCLIPIVLALSQKATLPTP